ncbi:MAG: hypothetical protein II776_05300, partial [Clostridia bacterium]|nr:hypothetical protein [Clostridia bacterium]
FSKAWWDMNAIEGVSIAGKYFYVCGDASTMDDRGGWVIFVNRDIISRARLEDPYQVAREGKWTVDKMYEYMVATQEDLDGNGVWELGKDRFGYIGEQNNNYFHISSFNIPLSQKSATGDIIIPATLSDELLAAWDALRPILATHYRDVSDKGGRFTSGLGTFFGCNLGCLYGGSMNKVNFGILPMPKLNEQQEEYWTAAHHTITFGYSIPVTTDLSPDAETNGFDSGREQAAYFLEAFSYWSRQTLTVAFYDQVMLHQMVQDAETVEMLELALKNKHFDPVAFFDFGQIGISLFRQVGPERDTIGNDANYDTLVSTYESRVEAARKALRNYVNYVTQED